MYVECFAIYKHLLNNFVSMYMVLTFLQIININRVMNDNYGVINKITKITLVQN